MQSRQKKQKSKKQNSKKQNREQYKKSVAEYYLRRFLRDFFFFLDEPEGLCKVDQQNNWTRMIPINAPELSMQTSLTDGLRPATKD